MERTRMVVTLSILAVVSVAPLSAWAQVQTQTVRFGRESVARDNATERLVQFIRKRMDISDNTKLTASPLRDSEIPGFYETTVKSESVDGSQHHQEMQSSLNLLLSKDGHYVVADDRYSLGPDLEEQIAHQVRGAFDLPATAKVAVGPPQKSIFSGFNEVGVTVTDGNQRRFQQFYLTEDNRVLILGVVFPLVDPGPAEFQRIISTENQPSQGPADAKVTIVEYADVECPRSAEMHHILETDVLPKYRGKVRVVYKDLPWSGIWTWTWEASIANQCAYDIRPDQFAAYRTLIFRNQSGIEFSNSRDVLLKLADKAGIDRGRLAACVESESSRQRLDHDVTEARLLGVGTTPTSYVNGKRVVGIPSLDDLYRVIDEALRNAQ